MTIETFLMNEMDLNVIALSAWWFKYSWSCFKTFV